MIGRRVAVCHGFAAAVDFAYANAGINRSRYRIRWYDNDMGGVRWAVYNTGVPL